MKKLLFLLVTFLICMITISVQAKTGAQARAESCEGDAENMNALIKASGSIPCNDGEYQITKVANIPEPPSTICAGTCTVKDSTSTLPCTWKLNGPLGLACVPSSSKKHK